MAFNEAEHAAFRGTGSSSITGPVVVTGPDGVTHWGIQDYVTLIPVTSYTKEMVDREIVHAEYLAPSDARFHKYVRVTTTDGRGNFTFDQVAPGDYFVTCLVDWLLGDINDGIYEHQWACERVTVGRGQTLHLKVSRNLQPSGRTPMLLTRFE